MTLINCGITVNALNLIKYFITDRAQQVRLKGALSNDKTNCFTVPLKAQYLARFIYYLHKWTFKFKP
jgi:hypothetical protein